MRRLALCLLVVAAWFAPAHARADVKCVQAFLAGTAFDPGPVDGQWGRMTGEAVQAAFAQIQREVDGGLGRDNTDAICALFQGPDAPAIAELLAFRIYPIEMKPGEDLLADPTTFDFSKVKVANGANYEQCFFQLKRYLFNEPEINTMAQGQATITDGWVTVTNGSWRTGGFAKPEQLIEQTNLALTTDGRLAGRMIYYERFIPQGEVFEPPIYVTLPERFEKDSGNLPNGETFFRTNSWSEGSIVFSCR